MFISKEAITKIQAIIVVVIIVVAAVAAYVVLTMPPAENKPPLAVAEASATVVSVGETVTFSAEDSSDPDGTIDTWNWNFGDGTTGTGETVTHSYNYGGRYIILLRVFDDKGANATNDNDLLFLDVSPAGYTPTVESPPIARIGVSKDVAEVDDDITFNGKASTGWYISRGIVTPTTADIIAWNWDFGDGTTGTGGEVDKAYDAEGNYPAKLSVKSNTTSLTDTTFRTVRVVKGAVAPTAKKPDTYTFASAVTLKAGVIDPVMQTGSPGRALLVMMTNTLVWYPPGKTEPEPLLAESYDVSADGLTYTFTLRQGVKFWNNEEVTAEDVQYTFWRFMAMNIAGTWCDQIVRPLAAGYGAGDYIPQSVLENAVQVVDTYTVRFKLPERNAPFLSTLCIPIFGILNKDYAITRGSWSPGQNWTGKQDPGMNSGQNLMGCGPYKLVELVPNERVILERFDDYWEGPAPLKRVVWLEIIEWSTRQLMLINGDIDATHAEASQAAVIKGTAGVTVQALPHGFGENLYFGFNRDPALQPAGSDFRMDIFDDVHMRLGFAYAFPYDEYLQEALLGMVDRAYSNISPGYLGYFEYQKDYTYNATKAAEEFQLAWGGTIWEEGFTMAFGYQPWMAEAGLIMGTLLKESLLEINPKFNIMPVQISWPSLLYYPLFAAWAQSGPDPQWYNYNWRSEYGTFASYSQYKNEALDALLDSALTTPDPTERNALYEEATEIMHDDPACLHIDYPPTFFVYRNWLQNVEQSWQEAWWTESPYAYGLTKG